MDKTNLLTIDLFARLCRTTPRTIRFFDEKGLLKPILVDPFTKYRYYDPSQAREFFKLRLLQQADMPISQIQQTTQISSTFLDKKLEEMKDSLEDQKKRLKFFTQMKKVLFETKTPETYMKEEAIGSFVLLCLRNDHGRYDNMGEDIKKLTDMAQKHEVPLSGQEMTFYLEPFVYKPKDTKLEMAVITTLKKIPGDISLEKGYYFKFFPKTPVKVFTYKGPFAYSALIYQKLHEGSKNKEVHPHEMYFDYVPHGPWDKESEYDYVMKLCFPSKH